MKRIVSLCLGLFLIGSLAACGGTKEVSRPAEEPARGAIPAETAAPEKTEEPEETAAPEQHSEYCIENERARLEFAEYIPAGEVPVPRIGVTITNISDESFYSGPQEVRPGETITYQFGYEPTENGVCYCGMELHDADHNRISTIVFNISCDEDGTVTAFETIENSAVSAALSNILKIEQVGDAFADLNGKCACGDEYVTRVPVRVTNTGDVPVYSSDFRNASSVLAPGESVEFDATNYSQTYSGNLVCAPVVEVPFTVYIQYFEYNGSEETSDYELSDAASVSIEIEH